MGSTIPLTNPQICRYAIGNPWNHLLACLADLTEEFMISAITCCLSGPSRLLPAD